jgi:hypothetical protein
MTDMKPLHDRDPARATLAAAIALEAGARRDLQVAEEAASLAAERCWDAQSRLEAIRKAPPAPSGSLADSFIASVGAGNPCGTAVLERSSVESRAKLVAAENEAAVWDETRQECEIAVRAKEAAVVTAKERVERAARIVLANSDMAEKLFAGLEEMQAELIWRRVGLRFIIRQSELAGPLRERIESFLKQDRLPVAFEYGDNNGWDNHPLHKEWAAAFNELLTNSEAALPTEFAGAV